MANIHLHDIIEAYIDCRKNKRRSPEAIAFEVNYEQNCIRLLEEIKSGTFKPDPSIAFVVTKPVRREIMASSFRDRVVHHYIAMRLTPLFEDAFIDETTNCRKGKGTSAGISQLSDKIKKVSKRHTSDCWVLRLDIKSFFMSINKALLLKKLISFVNEKYKGSDLSDLIYLIESILMNDPTENCIFRSPRKAWRDLPFGKSLFDCPKGFGLAPGNLTSQLEANFLLNDFDHWAKSAALGYGRYVDDFYFIHNQKEKLNALIPQIKSKLQELGLSLHPDKIYLQHYTKGVKFIGAVLKYNRKYLSNRTVGNFYSAIHRFNGLANKEGYIENNAEHFVSSMNSYLGFCRQYMAYNIRRKAIKRISKQWWTVFYISGHFEKLTLKKKYKSNSKLNNS